MIYAPSGQKLIVLVCSSPPTPNILEPDTKTWVQIVYVKGGSRKHREESGTSET